MNNFWVWNGFENESIQKREFYSKTSIFKKTTNVTKYRVTECLYIHIYISRSLLAEGVTTCYTFLHYVAMTTCSPTRQLGSVYLWTSELRVSYNDTTLLPFLEQWLFLKAHTEYGYYCNMWKIYIYTEITCSMVPLKHWCHSARFISRH